jgi:hypothetical protein
VAPSVGAASCTPCGVGFKSSANSTECDTCVPSLFSPSKFKCYTELEKVLVVSGMIVTVLSSLFSVYKLRIVVDERVQRLQAAGIKPTVKHIVFVERALAIRSKRLKFSLVEMTGSLDETRPGSDESIAHKVRDLQRQLKHVQEQLQQEFEQRLQQQQHQQLELEQKLQQQQQQQQQQLLEQKLQKQQEQHSQEIQELMLQIQQQHQQLELEQKLQQQQQQQLLDLRLQQQQQLFEQRLQQQQQQHRQDIQDLMLQLQQHLKH